MAQVSLVNKQVQMMLDEIIKFQIITYCYINKIVLTELDIDCLVNLGRMGSTEITEFCNLMADKRCDDKLKIWKPDTSNPLKKKPEASPQTIRNVLIKIEKEKLLFKEGKRIKKISLNPALKVQTTGNIVLNYKFVYLVPKES